MIAEGLMERVERLVLVSCEAFDNYPPGIPGWVAARSAKLPGGLAVMAQAVRFRWIRQLPVAFGWMSKREFLRRSSRSGCARCAAGRSAAMCASTQATPDGADET